MSAFVHLSLCHGQQTRSNLVCGVGAQDACVITHLKPPRLIHPSLLLVSSSHGGRSSGEIRYSSSSFWRRLSVSTNSSNSSGMYRMPVFVERSGCCLSLSERT
jgi:hypothetical protein